MSRENLSLFKWRPTPFPKEDNSDIVKIHWRLIKISFPGPLSPFKPNLAKKHFGVKGREFQFVHMIFLFVFFLGGGGGLSYFNLCSGLSSDGFFSVPHLLWHGHPFKMVMIIYEDPWHTPIAERLAVEMSIPVSRTYVCRGWDSNTKPSACGANALTYCSTAPVVQMNGHGLFQTEIYSETLKIHLRLLKVSFSRANWLIFNKLAK